MYWKSCMICGILFIISHMYRYYTWVLWVKFTFLIMSLLAYGFTFYCLYRAKLHYSFSGKLYLAMSISQLLIILPNLLIPYFSNWNGDPHLETIISETPCMFQGVAIMFGWVTASFLSILDCFIVVRSLQGKEFNKSRQWKMIIGSYILGALVMIPIFLYGDIQVKQVGWDGDQKVYGFCNAQTQWMQYTFFVLDGVVFLLLITLYMKIYTLINQISLSAGIDCDQILIRVYNFSFCQIILWTTNLLCKFLLSYRYTVIEILSFIYYLEGVLMGYYFIRLYRTHLLFLPKWLTNLTRLGQYTNKKDNNVMLIYDSSDAGSQRSSYIK